MEPGGGTNVEDKFQVTWIQVKRYYKCEWIGKCIIWMLCVKVRVFAFLYGCELSTWCFSSIIHADILDTALMMPLQEWPVVTYFTVLYWNTMSQSHLLNHESHYKRKGYFTVQSYCVGDKCVRSWKHCDDVLLGDNHYVTMERSHL
jgi:hypothetical protein